MAILNRILKIRDQISIACAFIFVSLFFLWPIFLPAIAAANIKTFPILLIIISGIAYLIVWFVAFLLTLDSAAYVYGFQRPYLSTRYFGYRLRLGDTRIKTSAGFVIHSLISYGFTLYGFSIAYVLISQLNPLAFNIREPLDFVTSVYFTIVTAATVGYGDIAPVSKLARCFVSIEIILSFLYIIFIFSTVAGLAKGRIDKNAS